MTITTISGGIFNFTDNTYTPPPLLSGIYNFKITIPFVEELYQIYSDTNYIYGVTNAGLKVFDIETGAIGAKADYNGGFTTITGDTANLYLGTSTSGIMYLEKSTITDFNIYNPVTISSVSIFKNYPNITSNYIKYLHISADQLLTTTTSGVDYYKMEGNPTYHSFTTISGAKRCFMTNKKAYYITTSGTTDIINVMNNCLCDWAEPHKQYILTTMSGIPATTINDLFITEGTAINNIDNCIFMATNSGIHIIDEYSNYIKSFYKLP